jgi:hypothetical protein
MPGDPGATVVTNARAFYTPRAAAGATGTRHSPLPPWGSATPSISGRKIPAQLGRNALRECEGVFDEYGNQRWMSDEQCVPRMLRSAPLLRRDALLIRGQYSTRRAYGSRLCGAS